MTKYSYIVTEGPQDISFLSRLLIETQNLQEIKQKSLVDNFWQVLVPTSFPVNDDLTKRVPVPVFLKNNELSVALNKADGLERLAENIEENLSLIDPSEIFGIALFLDADQKPTPQERFKQLIPKLQQKFNNIGINLSLPQNPGEVTKNSPRFGIFIAPDNKSAGTLEDILLQCAEKNYLNLLNCAKNYISSVKSINEELEKKDLKEFLKPAGESKAILSSITSILKPGRTLQVSIQDNRWINEETIKLEILKTIIDFFSLVTGYAEDGAI